MSTHDGGELPRWPTMLRRSASSMALGSRRIGFGSHALGSLMKLESIHRQLCTSATDLASRLKVISTMMDEISTALKSMKPDDHGDHVKIALDWKGISEVLYFAYFVAVVRPIPDRFEQEYAACLVDIRSLAVSGSTIINGAQTFYSQSV